MEFTAKQIAGFVNGTIEGDDTATVNDIARIEDGKPKALSFLANPKYNQYLYETKSSIVLINKDFELEKPVDCTLIRVDDAYTAFATILSAYQEAKIANKTGISPTAVIDPSAKIGNNCYIGEYVVIGAGTSIGDNTKIYAHSYMGENVTIGKDCLIYSGVKILDDCIIGNDCTFHAGVVIGSDGFGFAPQQDADFKKVAQIGNVIIEDRVELGANTTVDRATIGSTIIRRGVKIDNLCQVAHNVEVGENTVMAAQSGIAGSAKVGKNCMIGGQVAITGHITVANGVKIAGKSGVSGSIRKENSIHMGMPSFEHKKAVQSFIYFKRLPEMNARIEALEKEINSLKQKNS